MYRQYEHPVSQTPSVAKANKIPFIDKQKLTDGMKPGQKEFIRLFNLMVDTLQENGLMEDQK